jgi:glutathione S-transferase
MQQIADRLEKLNLGQYAQRFAENDIDVSVLRHLTDADQEKIGVSLVDHWTKSRQEIPMKLYMHPISTPSRSILMLIAENGLEIEQRVVDIMTGEHLKEPFISLNPNGLVPLVVDDDLILTEGSAILKYLADKFNLSAYPKDLKQRAKVNESMDWFVANFYRDFAFGLVYPQIFPNFKRPSVEVQSGTIEWGKKCSNKWLKVLNDYIIGPQKNYLTGDSVTIADYLGAAQLSIGEWIGCDFGGYPNANRWLENMKNRPSWAEVNEAFCGLREALKGQEFITV